jgi:hypothetical protein
MTNPRHHPDSPVAQLIDAMIDEQWQRHSWLIEAGERLRSEGDCPSGTAAGRASHRTLFHGFGHSATIGYRKGEN